MANVAWLKELAPSNALRKWFAPDPKKWLEFKRRYARELEVHPAELQPLLKAAGTGDVTLLYSARDTERNNAIALQAYLNRKLNNRDKHMK
jgi:uncharacterized protein YeaO (DUF488 family)